MRHIHAPRRALKIGRRAS
ncbi:DUF1534 domain-containing protein, partial [Pseudomonas syringae pv. actinidiae]|nr:DUF1534 domain-containing protein [Pseudomonas syringae pv. actinidiae]